MINLPFLDPDPISKRLDTNHETLSSLTQKVDNLSVPFYNTQKALVQLVSSLKDQLSSFSASVSSLAMALPEKVIKPSGSPPLIPNPSSNVKGTSSFQLSIDRSANVILFGVPELPLAETKSVFDDITQHMIRT